MLIDLAIEFAAILTVVGVSFGFPFFLLIVAGPVFTSQETDHDLFSV